MDYYSLYALTLFLFVIATLGYFTRSRWLPATLPDVFPFNRIQYQPVRGNFTDDAASGLHSSNFDLSANIEAGDSRAGLDDSGKQEVKRIMKRDGLTFDEARRQVMMNRFKSNNIGPDGRPRDPKFVSFS